MVKTHKKPQRKRNGLQHPKNKRKSSTSSVKWVLVFIVILCSGLAAYWGFLHLQDSGETAYTKERENASSEAFEYTTAYSELAVEEQAAALKKEEMEVAETTMRIFADNVDALEMTGDFHSRYGRRAEAVKFWQRCLEINPDKQSVYRSLGWTAMDMGDYEKAIEEYRKALEINPQAKGIHREIGRALVELGQFDEAIEELEKELRVSPNAGMVNFLLGQAYFKLKDYNKAREHYEAEIKVNPDYENAYYNLIRIYTVLKETEKAKEAQLSFEDLREQSSKNERVQRMGIGLPGRDVSTIRDSVVRTYLDAEKLHRAKGDMKKAESLLKRAILIDPNNSKSFERLGSLYTMTERFPEALRQFERISKIEPSNHLSYMNIGSISTVLQRFDAAERAFKKAIEVAPDESKGYLELARLYLTTKKKHAEARRLAYKAVSLETSGKGFFIFGWACDVTGDRNGAIKAMEQAIRLEPKNAKYRQIYEGIKNRNY